MFSQVRIVKSGDHKSRTITFESSKALDEYWVREKRGEWERERDKERKIDREIDSKRERERDKK